MNVNELKPYITDVYDFPKKGIVFKDISTLLASAKARKGATALLLNPFRNNEIDVVIGIESRGFLFGTEMANELDAAFVMVRKPGKLPGKVISQHYALEYGSDALEIQEGAIKKGNRVLIHDDVLATGGTAQAVKSLVEKCGGIVVAFSFLITIEPLKGIDKLESQVYTVLNY